MVVQPGLYRTWSEKSKTGFLTTRLINSTNLYFLNLKFKLLIMYLKMHAGLLEICFIFVPANAKALINLMYVNNTMHLGLRSHEVHTHLRWGDIQLLTTATGEEYLEYNERATKTRTGATSDCRPFKPKMFAQPS